MPESLIERHPSRRRPAGWYRRAGKVSERLTTSSLVSPEFDDHSAMGDKGQISRRWPRFPDVSELRMRISPLLAGALGVAALTVIAWLRLRGSTKTLWAEDGGIFLPQALNSTFAGGIFDPYEGYLHVVPGILSHIALQLGPIDEYAVIISWISCFTTASVGVAVFFLSRQLIGSIATRSALAVIPVLLPVAPFEVLGNTANLHWFMLWLVIWVVVHRPSRWLTSCGLAAAAFLAATSEIQTIIFLPVGIFAAWRERARIPATVGLTIGLVMQVFTALRFPRSASPDTVPWDFPSIVIGWLLQGVYSIIDPSASSVGAAWGVAGAWVLVIPTLMVVVTAAVGWRAGGVVRIGTLGFLAASVAFWVAAQTLNNREFMNYAEMTPSEWAQFVYLRYAVAPGMFFLGAVAIAASGGSSPRNRPIGVGATRPRGRAWWGPMAWVALAVIFCVNYFPSESERWNGPVWSAQVAAARVSCMANPSEQTAVALVAPRGWEHGQVPLPCSRLRR